MKKLLADLNKDGSYLRESFWSPALFFVPHGRSKWAKEIYSLAIFSYLKGYDWIIIPSDQNFCYESWKSMNDYIDSIPDGILRIIDSDCIAISSKIAFLENSLIESCYIEDPSKIEFKNGGIIPTLFLSQMKIEKPEKKSISIVGNGEITTGYRDLIEDSSFVLRMNLGVESQIIDSFQSIIGDRCDIFAFAPTKKISKIFENMAKNNDFSKVKELWIPCFVDDVQNFQGLEIIRSRYSHLKERFLPKIDFIDSSFNYSTGFRCVIMSIYFGFKPILFGFDFARSGHYWDRHYKHFSHPWEMEKDIIIKLKDYGLLDFFDTSIEHE